MTAGSAPNFSTSYNANNQQTGAYDANGNLLIGPGPYSQTLSYDVENRMLISVDGTTSYGYDPQNKRVLTQTQYQGANDQANSQFTFYGITGQRLSTFSVTSWQYPISGCGSSGRYCVSGPSSGYLYLAGKLIIEPNGVPAVTDRLGSQRNGLAYYPWGEDNPSSQPSSGQVAFGTYWRDMPGQDYADQRYFSATIPPTRAGFIRQIRRGSRRST